MSTTSQINHCPKKWIVGLDLRPSGQGALVYANWLYGAAKNGDCTLVGIHVLEEAMLQAGLRYHHLDELEAEANTQAAAVLTQAGAETSLSERHLLQGVHASRVLATAREYHQAGGVIVGRQAPREGRRILRLGRTARRLLRTLPGPVTVVPPDFEVVADDAPVVVATNLHDDSATAMHFGSEYAAMTGRPLVALHIVPEPEDYAAHYIPKDSREKIADEHAQQARLDLRQWLTGLGLSADREDVVAGHVTDTAVGYCKDAGAALLVCGSRRLSTIERLLLTSIGSDLAAHASCPVTVVPPLDADILP